MKKGESLRKKILAIQIYEKKCFFRGARDREKLISGQRKKKYFFSL